ncbi:MAG: hypothetical protein JWM07_598 [Candidatus Saccharibacteria bacterium]|nr:hypothetical protein [Candidatus Saccharibacteria bacterium]
MIGFTLTATIVMGLIWLVLYVFQSVNNYLLQFFYGEENMLFLSVKVIGVGVVICLIALLIHGCMRAVFSRSR